MGVTFSQLFPPRPTLMEENLPDQKGKVFIVTGGASGVGFELASILYRAGGKVYIAGRSETKARESIERIRAASTTTAPLAPTSGQLEFLELDLSDLSTIKTSVRAFLERESRLDVLWNNAGVSLPPVGSVSKQGHELQVATNCLGPFLFTNLLLPTLKSTAAEHWRQSLPPGSVRVVWTSSFVAESSSPKPGGLSLAELDHPPADQVRNYVTSKLGNWFLASELARRISTGRSNDDDSNDNDGNRDSGKDSVLSIVQNPGNLRTDILRHAPAWMALVSWPLLYHARFGAYTELWAGLSPDVTLEDARRGAYVIPWGRKHPSPRADLLDALKTSTTTTTTTEDGGTGQAAAFWAWCESKTADYM